MLVQLFDADDPATALDFATADVKAGQDWIFYTEVLNKQPVWTAGTLRPDANVTCEDIAYEDL